MRPTPGHLTVSLWLLVAATFLPTVLVAREAVADPLQTGEVTPQVRLLDSGQLIPPPPLSPPLPPLSSYPIRLVADSNFPYGAFGLAGTGGDRQFLWFQRFATAVDFQLHQIWVVFPQSFAYDVGDPVQLAVYQDPDGDPSSGAQLVASYPVQIQVESDNVFSVYTLPAPLPLEAGTVLIGVVNRYAESGVSPATYPAAFDFSSDTGGAWFAFWSGDPPASPDLAGATILRLSDAPVSQTGDFLIRGLGIAAPAPEVPVLDGRGLLVLVALLAAAAVLLLVRRG